MPTLHYGPMDSKCPNHWCNFEYCQTYDGVFDNWEKDQRYEGKFYGESFHCEGTYNWNTLGPKTIYEGNFYSNLKEGYATVSLPNNFSYEGLFIKNQPFGPGILTFPNGREDVGFWVGKKLIRLCRAVDFIIPRLAPTFSAKVKLLKFGPLIPPAEVVHDSATSILVKYQNNGQLNSTPYSSLIYDPRSFFFHKLMFDKMYFSNIINQFFYDGKSHCETINQNEETDFDKEEESQETIRAVPSPCFYSDTYKMKSNGIINEVDICDEKPSESPLPLGVLAYYTKHGTLKGLGELSFDMENSSQDAILEEEVENKKPLPPVTLNRSALYKEMLRQIFRYRPFEEKINFKIAKLMLGARTAFRRTGEKERQCIHFLKMCSYGPPYVIKDFLCNYEISEELMDDRGNNGLMFASAADQLDVIDILADYGVDVNAFNDEGLTPLNLCLLRRLAVANKIWNWEIAFLNNDLQIRLDDFDTEEWKLRESISSLDRNFGDGMSIRDGMDDFLDEVESFSASNSSNSGMGLSYSSSQDKLSEITILSFKNTKACLESEQRNPEDSGDMCTNIDITEKIIPRSVRRDEYEKSIGKANTDKYFFEFGIDKSRPVEVKKIEPKGRGKGRAVQIESVKTFVETIVEEPVDEESLIKLKLIDNTIEKLLRRGADPNISEVPKPSIHLSIYTKDLSLVKTLLQYKARPDTKLPPNEGLLTPLHVLVLLKSDPQYVQICETLLLFGANPEEQTTPDFFISEDEREFLDATQGRTPLQLLCMRPDLEWADPGGNLLRMALMLTKFSNLNHFYKGHTGLTLAMMTGNIKLLESLLESRYFDPNQILGNDLGTALHVLVSTKLQIKTIYENSVKMCDLLLENGADPSIFVNPLGKPMGNCIEYGITEIEDEKLQRKAESVKKDKKELKPDKNVRDYLKDHVRLVEYLAKRAEEINSSLSLAEYKSRRDEGLGKGRKSGDLTQISVQKKTDMKSEAGSLDESTTGKKSDKKDKSDLTDDKDKKDLMDDKKNKGDVMDDKKKRGKKGVDGGSDEDTMFGKSIKRGSKSTLKDSRGEAIDRKNKKQDSKGISKDGKKLAADGKSKKREGKGLSKDGVKAAVDDKSKKREGKGISKDGKKLGADGKIKKYEGKGFSKDGQRLAADGRSKKYEGKGFSKDGQRLAADGRSKKYEGKGISKDNKDALKVMKGKMKDGRLDRRVDSDRLYLSKTKVNRFGENLRSTSKAKISATDTGTAQQSKLTGLSLAEERNRRARAACIQSFPEKISRFLQRNLECPVRNINELLLPYVVLRDGVLYYKFQNAKNLSKEQYSMV